MKQKIKEWVERFPKEDVYNLVHCWRLQGNVDVWKNAKTVYCKPDNEYKNFTSLGKLEIHPKRSPMKKLPSGRMKYQEYKNNKLQNT